VARFPRSIFDVGDEPDPRFSLANERTFLAWIRTSLALAAAGVALEALDLPIRAELRFAAALLFVMLGIVAAAQSWVGWAQTETALRLNKALPGLAVGSVIAAGVIIAIILIGLGLLL
jgi:putative membrane protein